MGKVVAKRVLIAHPEMPAPAISVSTKLSLLGRDVLKIEYVVLGDTARLEVPEHDLPRRRDELWQHTCFEAFLAQREGGYLEVNLAPSGHYAVYRFESYRDGMQPALDLAAPEVWTERAPERFALTAYFELPSASQRISRAGLSAVVEETRGARSFWALAHPPGKPDFHHPDCFVLELAAPDAP